MFCLLVFSSDFRTVVVGVLVLRSCQMGPGRVLMGLIGALQLTGGDTRTDADLERSHSRQMSPLVSLLTKQRLVRLARSASKQRGDLGAVEVVVHELGVEGLHLSAEVQRGGLGRIQEMHHPVQPYDLHRSRRAIKPREGVIWPHVDLLVLHRVDAAPSGVGHDRFVEAGLAASTDDYHGGIP